MGGCRLRMWRLLQSRGMYSTYSVLQYSTAQYIPCVILYSTYSVLYSTVQCSTVHTLYSTVQYSTVDGQDCCSSGANFALSQYTVYILYSILYCTVLYSVLYCMLYYSVLYSLLCSKYSVCT